MHSSFEFKNSFQYRGTVLLNTMQAYAYLLPFRPLLCSKKPYLLFINFLVVVVAVNFNSSFLCVSECTMYVYLYRDSCGRVPGRSAMLKVFTCLYIVNYNNLILSSRSSPVHHGLDPHSHCVCVLPQAVCTFARGRTRALQIMTCPSK